MARWLPLESNPDVMNKYLSVIGVPESWKCVDICGFDTELLSMVPQPVAAVLLLFPITGKYEEFSKAQTEKLTKQGTKIPEGLYFMQQHIGNACGTVALIHALANNGKKINFDSAGIFKKFLDKLRAAKPEEWSKILEEDKAMTEAHEASAGEGQTSAPSRDDKVDLHFVCFVEHNGTLYELDGRKPFPVPHGATNGTSFLNDVAKTCKMFMEREPDNLRFTAIALAGAK